MTKEELIEAIKSMTVLELKELVDAIREEFGVTAAIFSEATLSFFGLLNIRMSWGIMIFTAQAAGYLLSGVEYWWLLIPAGASITLLCSAFYLVGRALDEVVNPRLRKR